MPPLRIYDRLAPVYDLLSASERPFRRRALGLLALTPADAFLEIGCGSGRDVALAAARARRAVGVDLAFLMLCAAQRRLKSAPAALVQADAAALPFAPACFHAVYLSFTLELLPPPVQQQALAEARRVLAPGGRAAVVCLARSERPGTAERIYGWFHRRFPRVVDCAPICPAQVLGEAGFAVLAREAGSLWRLPVEILLAG